ncbi:hypothetical protein C8Q80DRAFT_1123383 [Daedaleopsis nitida]|nr:hypothetical protein C8Q80DRAFT_1123383 [Daedaleopsis nitida]
MHSTIQWSNKDSFPLLPVTEDSPWTLIKQSKADADASKQVAMKRDTTNFVMTKQSVKRKRSMEEDEIDNTLKKKVRQIKAKLPPKGKTFRGIPWDKDNWSLYTESPDAWRAEASQQSDVLLKLDQFSKQSLATLPTMTVVQARNQIRDMLGCESPELGARGKTYTDLYELAERLLAVDEDMLTKTNVCRCCNYKSDCFPRSKSDVQTLWSGIHLYRIIDKSGGVWYHDGALPGDMGKNVTYSGNIINLPYQKLQAIKKEYHYYILMYSPTILINCTVPDLAHFSTRHGIRAKQTHQQKVILTYSIWAGTPGSSDVSGL